jgi:RNA polymerase sigma-70 factor (ECF subfamily)
MDTAAGRDTEAVRGIYERRVKTLYRVCLAYLGNATDAEDAVQDTFVRLIKADPVFASAEHEKAWLLRTAINVCKDRLKHWWRRRQSLPPADALPNPGPQSERSEILTVIMGLPPTYRTVLYLHYYEGYTSAELADLLGKRPSTVRNYLSEARTALRQALGDEFDEE